MPCPKPSLKTIATATLFALTTVLSNQIALGSPPDAIGRQLLAWVTGGVDGVICPGEVAAMAAQTDKAAVIGKPTRQAFDQFRPRLDTIYEDLRAAGRSLGHMLRRRMAEEGAETRCDLMDPTPLFRL